MSMEVDNSRCRCEGHQSGRRNGLATGVHKTAILEALLHFFSRDLVAAEFIDEDSGARNANDVDLWSRVALLSVMMMLVIVVVRLGGSDETGRRGQEESRDELHDFGMRVMS